MNSDDEASVSPDQLPWPRSGDQLFGPGDDWHNNAFVNSCFDSWDLRASGFLEAAKILVKENVNSRRSPDAVVYPIAFLYRHYLELRLKAITIQGQELLNRRAEIPMVHDLKVLWKTARKKEPVEAVEESIVQFCNLDRHSLAFRYPTDKSGNRLLPPLKLLNVRQLGEVMERISKFLESVSSGIAEYFRISQENQQND